MVGIDFPIIFFPKYSTMFEAPHLHASLIAFVMYHILIDWLSSSPYLHACFALSYVFCIICSYVSGSCYAFR